MSSHSIERYLFVYEVGQHEDIWVFADGLYRRFSLRQACIGYIRAETHLPRYAEGRSIGLSQAMCQRLAEEAEWHHFSLTFHAEAQVCAYWAALEEHPEMIFGQTAPAGYFNLWGEISRQKDQGS